MLQRKDSIWENDVEYQQVRRIYPVTHLYYFQKYWYTLHLTIQS